MGICRGWDVRRLYLKRTNGARESASEGLSSTKICDLPEEEIHRVLLGVGTEVLDLLQKHLADLECVRIRHRLHDPQCTPDRVGVIVVQEQLQYALPVDRPNGPILEVLGQNLEDQNGHILVLHIGQELGLPEDCRYAETVEIRQIQEFAKLTMSNGLLLVSTSTLPPAGAGDLDGSQSRHRVPQRGVELRQAFTGPSHLTHDAPTALLISLLGRLEELPPLVITKLHKNRGQIRKSLKTERFQHFRQ